MQMNSTFSSVTKSLGFFIVSCLMVTSGSAFAQTVQLISDRDNTLYQSDTGERSNGSGDFLFAGRSAQSGNSFRRGLLHFDLSSIPAGSTINNVQLDLTSGTQTNGTRTFTLHRLNADWGEGTSNAGGQEGGGTNATDGDATWIHTFSPSGTWATAGGDFNATASATTTYPGPSTTGSFTGGGLVADVQSWVDGGDNFGWAVLGDETDGGTAYQFLARESVNNAPMLTVDFTAPTVLLGDVNLSGGVDFLDIAPFIAVLSASGNNQAEADIDQSGTVDFLDIAPFIEILNQ